MNEPAKTAIASQATVAVVVLAALVAYLGAYLTVVGGVIYHSDPPIVLTTYGWPDSNEFHDRGFLAMLFFPLNQFDRLLRPGQWDAELLLRDYEERRAAAAISAREIETSGASESDARSDETLWDDARFRAPPKLAPLVLP